MYRTYQKSRFSMMLPYCSLFPSSTVESSSRILQALKKPLSTCGFDYLRFGEKYVTFETLYVALRALQIYFLAHKLSLLNNNERWRASNRAIRSCPRQASLPATREENRECDFMTTLIYTGRDVGVQSARSTMSRGGQESAACNTLHFVPHYFRGGIRVAGKPYRRRLRNRTCQFPKVTRSYSNGSRVEYRAIVSDARCPLATALGARIMEYRA